MQAYWRAVLVLVVGVLLFSLDASAQNALTPLQKRHLSGFASHEVDLQTPPQANLLAPLNNAPSLFLSMPTFTANYFPAAGDECKEKIGTNVKVNQNCLNLSDSDLQGRGQAANETTIAQDPNHPNHLVASKNDYRRGDGACIAAYSLDNGQHWEDSALPVGFTRGTAFGGVAREYWQASGDPSVAWDSKGNAYHACQAFERGAGTTNNPDRSSAVYVFRSTLNNGASWNFPGRAVVETYTTTGAPLEDKPYMTVDNHTGSPFQDRIYVTWTEFAADGSAYIWGSYSQDYGETFSPRVLVSRNNTTLCTNTFGAGTPQGNCNENQYSQPFTGSDGALYVVYANFNNSLSSLTDNHNQILLAKSADGGATFSGPVLVGNYYDLPDCATYQGQDFGRACVPEKGSSMNSVFRATNYPVGAVNPKYSNVVAVTFGSYINVHSNELNGCVPAGASSSTGNNLFTGVKTAGACNNDILLSVSNNGGATFTGGATDPRALTTVNQAQGQGVSDQFWQWAAFTRSGALAVSYYDRKYGSDETTGSSDVSLSWSFDVIHFGTVRVTSSSMPTPTQFPDSQGNSVFFGDYSGLSAVGDIHPIWMDTRNPDLFLCPGTGAPGVPPAVCTLSEPNGLTANTQDVFTTTVSLEDDQH